MTREQFDEVRKRLRSTLDGIVTIEKRELERVVTEVLWLKRRLHRVEDAIEPLVSELKEALRSL